MKKYDDFKVEVTKSVIKAVQQGGYTNVYITDKLSILTSNDSKSAIEMGGTNILYMIECQNFSDLGYENKEGFIYADAETHYIDNLQEELEEVYKKVSSSEKLHNILEDAKDAFSCYQNEGNILVWADINNSRKYEIYNIETYLECIRHRFESIIEDLDIEEIESLDYDKVLNEEFDYEYRGVDEYYDPIEKFRHTDYKYCYLIILNIHTNIPKHILVTKVYSNIEIKSNAEMAEILEEQGEETPGEFGIPWANYYFSELTETDIDNLYRFISADTIYTREYVGTVFVD